MLSLAVEARAQTVQIAPFAGYQLGGSLVSNYSGQSYSVDGALVYGGTLDFALGETWRLELLYSRQPTSLLAADTGVALDLMVERYRLGVQEEKGEGPNRYYGTLLLGTTRFAPALSGAASESRFALGISLGLKRWLSKHVGLRAEGLADYTFVEAEGGTICANGQCLFRFSGSGFWQFNANAGLILAF